jgi:hypothetical protein
LPFSHSWFQIHNRILKNMTMDWVLE